MTNTPCLVTDLTIKITRAIKSSSAKLNVINRMNHYCTVLYSSIQYCIVQYSKLLYCTVLYCNQQNESSRRNEMNEALGMQRYNPENKALMFASIQTRLFIFSKPISVFVVLSPPELCRTFPSPSAGHDYKSIIVTAIYDCFLLK